MADQAAAGARETRRRDLTTGPIASSLLLFALPTLGSNILQSLNGSINAVWVGRFLGEDALAATANGNIVMFLLTAFVFGFGMAATILIGQAFGARDVDRARAVLGTALGSFFVVTVIIAVLGWIFAPDLLRLLATPPGVQGLALDYMRVIFVAMPGALMLVMLMMALRGGGDSLTPLWFMILSVILDTTLNPVLILGLGPAPRLGIAGAATATAIANYAALAALVAYIYARDLPLRLRGRELRYFKPDLACLRIIFAKGLPMGLQMIVISSSALTMLGLINREGADATAAYTVAQQLWTYIQMPAMALSAAASGMAAQNVGAGRWDRISKITQWGVVFNFLLTGALILLITVADRWALGLFLGADSHALPLARHIHLLASWGFLCFGVSMVLFGTVRANGEVIWPLIILFISMYPVRLAVAFGTRDWLGQDALWLSFPIGMASTMVMAIILYRQGGWRTRRPGSGPMPEREAVELAVSDAEPGGSLTPRASMAEQPKG